MNDQATRGTCDWCEGEFSRESVGWLLYQNGMEACARCVEELRALEVQMRAALPKRIALCPSCCAPGVVEDFYYPLADGEEPTCPTPECGMRMVVYEAERLS